MKAVKVLFICHLAALIFGLAGLLIALPHPELWSFSPLLVSVFSFGINYAGSLHILFGAATVLLFGLRIVGARRTLIFFAASTLISLSMELVGTSTGFPFGPYSYNSFLGFKILDHVPYSIPLSWFYMGFSSFLLAHLLLNRGGGDGAGPRRGGLWTVLLGAYLLTVWDLTLDPAMASERLPLHFWQWGVRGAYFGMPVQNLIGWSVTGLLYMGVSRLLWRSDLAGGSLASAAWLPFGVYAANTVFAIVLDLSVGLWLPPLLGLLLGILPAALVLRRSGGSGREQGASGSPRPSQGEREARLAQQGSGGAMRQDQSQSGFLLALLQSITRFVMRSGAALLLWRRRLRIVVEGRDHLAARGPVIVAARHYHHLYDGCLFLRAVPRPVHILVALDWARTRWQRRLMELLCALAGWPVMLRPERLRADSSVGARAAGSAGSAYRMGEVAPYLLRAMRQAVALLRRGSLLVIFPEGYPVVDPHPSPRSLDQALLPFRPGFARLVELAERESGTSIPVVPAGIVWSETRPPTLTLRLGAPLFRRLYADTAQFMAAVESCVRVLSGLDQGQGLALVSDKEVLHS
ncbi:carotenoid biosynthesis protein [Thermogemmatispora sp.]|uniref:carotenoid biosynthesis protein n=1 Tax=Thermogemmatispora sp. TaxID=1968838 RepID=UPI0035E43359